MITAEFGGGPGMLVNVCTVRQNGSNRWLLTRTQLQTGGAEPDTIMKDMAKRIVRPVGLYPAARRINRSLHDWVAARSTAREQRQLQTTRHKERLSFFRPLISEGDLVFDIGAHYGRLTQVFLDLGATVVACEPQADCLKTLRARRARVAKGRLVVANCALGSARAKGKFYVREEPWTSGFIADWHPGVRVEDVVEVEIVTLDDLIDKYGVPQYCKIDVEGYETEVLRGLTRPISLISFEYHTGPVRELKSERESAVTCLNYLSTFGNLSINVTNGQHRPFLFNEWVDRNYFLDFLTQHLTNLSGFRYGDIFVRTDSLRRVHEGGNLNAGTAL
jgi:FkbM family methyltransferase